jgi:hypothetical protein
MERGQYYLMLPDYLNKDAGVVNRSSHNNSGSGTTNASLDNGEPLSDHSDLRVLFDLKKLKASVADCNWDTTLVYYQVMLGILLDLKNYRDLLAANKYNTTLRKETVKNIFPTSYYHTTFCEMERIRDGMFRFPVNKMKQMLAFYDAFKRNRTDWEQKGEIYDRHWGDHFQKVETDPNSFLLAFESAVDAHVNYDLARALNAAAQVPYPDQEIRIDDYRNKYRDEFYATDQILYTAARHLKNEFPDPLNYAVELYDKGRAERGIEKALIDRKKAWESGLSMSYNTSRSKPLKQQPPSFFSSLYERGKGLCPYNPPPTEPLSNGSALLFHSVKSRLSNREKNELFQKLDVLISDTPGELLKELKKGDNSKYSVWIYPTDINKDGKEELFVSYGYSSDVGRARGALQLVIYIQDQECRFQPNMSFHGPLPEIIYPLNRSYPELIISGGSFLPEHGWDNITFFWVRGAYIKRDQLSDENAGRLKKISVEDYSKLYQAAIK